MAREVHKMKALQADTSQAIDMHGEGSQPLSETACPRTPLCPSLRITPPTNQSLQRGAQAIMSVLR